MAFSGLTASCRRFIRVAIGDPSYPPHRVTGGGRPPPVPQTSFAAAGAGFVTLAATLSSIHAVPVAGLVLLLGVDRFMNEARAVTNLIGNAVATIAVAKWDGAFI